MITIVDYNMGNIASVKSMIKKIGYESIVTSDPKVLMNAQKIVLPGVGSFDYGMKNLNGLCLVDVIKDKVLTEKVPLLGICLGMQLLTKGSEEGSSIGLGLIDAYTNRLALQESEKKLKVPHMGWNYVCSKQESILFKDMEKDMRFYFVHSYYVNCFDKKDSLAVTNYGNEFTCAFGRDNIFGVQFHPEKSHRYGMKLLKNFMELC